ncbi:MAG: GNAT family N-acetyltransferase [Betaproteobacteria bacterium]|nr:GNAT family N-acetyltransferase [Betaproteobacteria bacterium]
MHQKPPITELARLDRPALERHFLALDAEDRRLRFGIPLGDHAVRSYVTRIDFERDAVFGVFGDDLGLVGAAHLARGDGHAELGVSVLPGHRGRGLGAALLGRAHLRARNWGVQSLFMHCLTENGTMMRLARKQGMEIIAEQGEAEAWLKLPPPDAGSYFGEVFAQRVALFDAALKGQLASARRLAEALTRETT